MSMQYLDLGKARFVSTKANLLIETKASAGLYCDSGKHIDLKPSESWSDLGICEDIWIRKSHDFHLSFVASLAQSSAYATDIEMKHLEDIEHTLEAAQVQLLHYLL
jgi:hypothetical protein